MTAAAKPLDVVATIMPIALITHDIAGEHADIEVLLPSNASPHDYALKPSDLRKIKRADLIVWVGPELETFLQKPLSDKRQALSLLNAPNMQLQYFSDKEHDHGHHEGHPGEHHHSHAGIDPHIWLGTEHSKAAAKAIANALSKLDFANSKTYQANYKRFVNKIDFQVALVKKQLKKIRNKGYFLFHDGYGYFEHAFDLAPLGYLTVSPEQKPGAKTLVKIRRALQKNKAACIFSEPQFNPATVDNLVKGTQAKVVLIDPVASDLSLDTHSYSDFFDELSRSYVACFR